MDDYTKFRIKAINNHTSFVVLVKGWFGIWKSGYVYTNYFSLQYGSLDLAKEAINKYKTRYTEIT